MATGGITIGPILGTLETAKKERELWFGSYLFSWLMEHLCIELESQDCDIILPTLHKKDVASRVGLYPDRLYFTSKGTADEVYGWIASARESFVEKMTDIYYDVHKRYSSPIPFDRDRIKNIISNYLQVKWFVTEGDTTIAEALNYLETAELTTLTDELIASEPCDRCRALPHTMVVKDEYEDNFGKELYLCPICAVKYGAHASWSVSSKTGINDAQPFPSIIYIGAREISAELKTVKPKASELPDDAKIKLIAQKSTYLSYFAVLCLDMDNAGKLLASIQKDDKKVKEFSDALYKFNTEVTEFIAAYGGETIYAGGDDILALLPVRNRKSALSNGDGNADNLLDLISVINTHFNSTFKDKYQIPPGDNGKSVKLSLSFGVSLQYLKYPLKDALQSAYDSLFDVAKCTKNTLSIIIRKHAGATFQVTLGLDGIADYKDVFKLQSNKAFLPEGFYDSLTKIAAKLARTPANKIDALLKNHFNEDHHKAASCKFDRLEKILRDDLSLAVKTEAKEQAVENIVNLFRLAKLLES